MATRTSHSTHPPTGGSAPAPAQPVWSLTLPSWAASPAPGQRSPIGALGRLRDVLARHRPAPPEPRR